ncbi:hypothetical protein L228DRAFT_221161 [Xylona heveae TC161]|uniref:Uncharacterized protein n=1 Tax=Xylona heveae (strain CBS 132557 / TC161) TaxID=1328760 RepID=A0A165GKX3_XYLHT|nr:hypothetical protein L228DRAFT_221161 [Xylona heveae TC161]KZF22317.1 hypothetical protein L228DRAFT_221161 [Xylona heveae TC161]
MSGLPNKKSHQKHIRDESAAQGNAARPQLGGKGDAEESRGRPRALRRLSNKTLRPWPRLDIEGNAGGSSGRSTSSAFGVYMGSYRRSPYQSSVSLRGSSVPGSARASINHDRIDELLPQEDLDLETYGLEEYRDGLFDAMFFQPPPLDKVKLLKDAEKTLPFPLSKPRPWVPREIIPKHWHDMTHLAYRLTRTRAGVKLAKSFICYFAAYIICLIPACRRWLGPYNYIMAISAVLNHSGRSVGSQLDGTFLTILGTAAGLGWGSLALYVSTATAPSREGYGGILSVFLVLFTAIIAWVRCYYMRFYQAVICAGVAICFMCLADVGTNVSWRRVFDYGIPWVLGQAICLIVGICVSPDAGTRSMAFAIHNSFKAIRSTLELPRQYQSSIRRRLAASFVDLSQAVRDFTIELTVSRFAPDELRELRNLIQGVMRSVQTIRTTTILFNPVKIENEVAIAIEGDESPRTAQESISAEATRLICKTLAKPTRDLIDAMDNAIIGANTVLMRIARLQFTLRFPGANDGVHADEVLNELRDKRYEFDAADETLINDPRLTGSYSDHEVVQLFLFVHPVRQTADKVEALLVKVRDIERANRGLSINLPSYPFIKSLSRSNAQVRHDRGGLTAGSFFQSKRLLERTMNDLQSQVYKPAPRHPRVSEAAGVEGRTMGQYEEEREVAIDSDGPRDPTTKLRYKIWTVLHRLQDFESRFAFKVVLVTTLLSVPAWLDQSRGWWNANDGWWAVIAVWLLMHPRSGGNIQDLIARSFCAVLGTVWGGLAYGAGNGSPYVMGVFAAIFMIPMLYRFTQSTHPRSGIIGCISYTVVSLTAYTDHAQPSIVTQTWTRGVAFLVGVMAAVVVNWVFWPFVARHELRKSLSSMMLHAAILYRGVVGKYIYYGEGEEPSKEDVERSEMLEGRLREGFVRIRQLMALTRHEIRLRGPFDPLPSSALIAALERFFDHLISVRQSSLYFRPTLYADNPVAMEALLSVRRDAVAAILMNLYILAGALRSGRPVPRYLPSAAAARKRLLDRMHALETELRAADQAYMPNQPRYTRRWADVYQYAYSAALTDIVEQLQQLQRYTKAITGEVGFDPPDDPGTDETY